MHWQKIYFFEIAVTDEPLNMPWHTFFGGEEESKAGKG